MRDALGGITRRQAIDRLLETGAFRAEIVRLTPELLAGPPEPAIERLVAYKVTEFGAAVARYGMKELGFESPELQRMLEEAGGSPDAR